MKPKALIVTSVLWARTGTLASRLACIWSTLFVLVAVVNCPSPRAMAQAADSPARISVPGSNGVFEITVGPTEWSSIAEPDGKEVSLEAMRRPDELFITAFLRRVAFAADPKKCQGLWPQVRWDDRLRPDDFRDTTGPSMVTTEYFDPATKNAALPYKTLFAWMGSRDLCVMVHLSKEHFRPEDQKLFDTVLATARLSPDAPPVPLQGPKQDAFYFLMEGTKHLAMDEPQTAIELLQKGLDLERKNKTLSKNYWHTLVYVLANAYINAGAKSQAEETLAYGIGQDPKDPLFYYSRARLAAGQENMEETLKQLRLAYKNGDSTIAVKPLPDPLEDDSFRNFVKDARFVQSVREMQRR